MPRAARAAWVRDYLAYLRAREGHPDLARRSLPNRERLLDGLAPIPIDAPLVDQATFDRNVLRRAPEEGLDPLTLWALALAKGNRAERYGIELKLRVRGFEPDGADDPYTFVELQELYHTRIFVSILSALGVTSDIHPPAGLTRAVVTSIGCMPHAVSDVVALSAELTGVAAFRLLLEEGRRLLAPWPALSARVEQLLGSVLVDEVGHVRFLRTRLGGARLSLARRMLPLVARGMIDDIPELVVLLGRDRYLAEVFAADVDAADAPFEDRSPRQLPTDAAAVGRAVLGGAR